MAYATDLKKYLPESQRNSTSLNEFMDAVGELLDGFKIAIDDVQKYNDFQTIQEKNLDDLAKQFDIEFPRNMSVERKRAYLREIVTLYRSKGTTNSIKRIFRLIGWDVDIYEYWIVNPSWYASTTDTYVLTNEQNQSISLGLYDTIIGNTKTYKNDKIYIDLVDGSGNIYPTKQIYGEPYKIDDVNFVKVPYIKINVKSEDFDLFTSDYVEDGNIYSYDDSEEFEILTSIKDYMLDRIRPATVAIVEISTPFSISDTIVYTITESDGYAKYTGSTELVFNESGSPQTITRTDGSWIDDGFKNESPITVSNSLNYDGTYKVLDVTAGNLTLYKEQPLLKNPELLNNGMFTGCVSCWGGTNALLSSRGNTIHVESVVNGVSNTYQQISTVVGKTYEVSAELVSSALTGDASIRVGTTIGGQDVGYRLLDTVLETNGWDLTTASYDSVSYDFSPASTIWTLDAKFRPDGLRAYVISDSTNQILEYDLSAAWDITSITPSGGVLSVSAQTGTPSCISFSSDGNRLYVGDGNTYIYQYDLGAAWSISSAIYNSVFYNISPVTSIRGLHFREDGSSMYVSGTSIGGSICQFDLSTPWDLGGTVTPSSIFSVDTEDTAPDEIVLSTNGDLMYVIGNTGGGVHQYTLTTPWSLASVSYVDSFGVSLIAPAPKSIQFGAGKMFILSYTNETVYQFSIDSLGAKTLILGTYDTTFVSPATTLYVSLSSSTEQLAGESIGWDNASVKLSDNLVGNGEFNSDIQWSMAPEWQIADGVASHNVAGSGDIYQTVSLVEGQAYKYTLTVSEMTAGYIQPKFTVGSAVYGERIYADGTYTGVLIAGASSANFGIASSVTFVGSVDNISLVEVDEKMVNGIFHQDTNWTKFTGTTITTGELVATGNGAARGGAEQAITTVIGQVYEVTFDASVTSGLFNVGIDNAAGDTNITGVGQYGWSGSTVVGGKFTFKATATTTYIKPITEIPVSQTNFDNISVVPVNNLVTNGVFTLDDKWTKGTGWSISSGVATHTTGTASFMTQTISVVSGNKYALKYTISNYISGSVQMNIQGTAGTPRTANGTYFEVLDSTLTNGDVEFSATLDFDGSVDSVQVVEVPELITDYYFNNNTSNVGAKYDGTITYGTTTDRYILGESMGGFKYGTTDMKYYGIHDDAPAESFSRTYSDVGGAVNVDQPMIAVRNHSEVVFEIDDASEIVSVYGVSNDRFSVVAGDPLITTALLINESTTGKHAVNVTGYYYVFVRTTFDAGQQIKVTYNLF